MYGKGFLMQKKPIWIIINPLSTKTIMFEIKKYLMYSYMQYSF